MMDREQIIQWAREAGFMPVTKSDPETGGWYECFDDELEAFAKLVRGDYSNKHAQLWLKRIDEAVKAEREACAKVAENGLIGHTIAKAIRARGNT